MRLLQTMSHPSRKKGMHGYLWCDDFVQNQGVFSYLIGTLQPILQFNIYTCAAWNFKETMILFWDLELSCPGGCGKKNRWFFLEFSLIHIYLINGCNFQYLSMNFVWSRFCKIIWNLYMPYYSLFRIDLAQHKQRKSGSKCWSTIYVIYWEDYKRRRKTLTLWIR